MGTRRNRRAMFFVLRSLQTVETFLEWRRGRSMPPLYLKVLVLFLKAEPKNSRNEIPTTFNGYGSPH